MRKQIQKEININNSTDKLFVRARSSVFKLPFLTVDLSEAGINVLVSSNDQNSKTRKAAIRRIP